MRNYTIATLIPGAFVDLFMYLFLYEQRFTHDMLFLRFYVCHAYRLADVVLILCSSVVYTTRRFMFGLALLFVYVFLLSF